MIAGFRTILVKFGVFAALTGLLTFILLNTMLNGLDGSSRGFRAEFTDVAGLRVGDDVRVAGVRVGRVTGIGITDSGAEVRFDLIDQQPLLSTTRVVMRYQNLLGQRYLGLVQGADRGPALPGGSTIPVSRTSPGFDLTELLNGFRPLFEALRPEDVNALATSMIKVLQGEGGTVQSLLAQTGQLTNYLADRDQLFGQVVDNLTPVLTDLAGQGSELRGTVRELRGLMTGLAGERKAIGSSIAGMSELIGSTADLVDQLRVPTKAAVARFRKVMVLFLANTDKFVAAIGSFGSTLAALGRPGSYRNSLSLYLCSAIVTAGPTSLNLNGSSDGPWSEVCR